jgi:hypothetical protein
LVLRFIAKEGRGQRDERNRISDSLRDPSRHFSVRAALVGLVLYKLGHEAKLIQLPYWLANLRPDCL